MEAADHLPHHQNHLQHHQSSASSSLPPTSATPRDASSLSSTPQPPSSAGGVTKRYRPAPAKTFQCRGFGECRMVFSRSEHLARHVRKHTGERPFSCHCGKQFSRLDNLRQHAQTVHSDKHAENELMMRELTSLHTQLAARSSKGSRDTPTTAPSSSEKRRGTNGEQGVGLGPGGARPGTSTGYEGQGGPYGAPPPSGHPPHMGLAIPYQHQMPQYPPPPGYPSLPPTGPYNNAPEYHSGYYPPPPIATQQPYGPGPAYSPQYAHPASPYPPGSVRYAPYPGANYSASANSQYANGPPGYPEGPTHSPGPHTPLTPSSTPLSANSAGAGHSFLGSGPPSAAGSNGNGSFLAHGPPSAGPTQTGSPTSLDPSSARTPIDPELQQFGGTHSFRAQQQQQQQSQLRSPVPSTGGYSPHDGSGHESDVGSGFGNHPGRHDRSPDDEIGDGDGDGGGYGNGTGGSGFRERGAGTESGFGNSNTSASRDHQQHQYHGNGQQSGFNGAAGRGEHRSNSGGRAHGHAAPDAGVGHESGRHPKEATSEVSTSGTQSRRTGGPIIPRKADASGYPGGVHSESGFSSQRSGRLGVPARSAEHDQYFRSLHSSSGSPHGGSHEHVPTSAPPKTATVLPPLAALVASRNAATEHKLGGLGGSQRHQQSFPPDRRPSGGPPGSSGGFPYLSESEFGRPGTAPAAYLSGDGPSHGGGSRGGLPGLRYGGERGPERLGLLSAVSGGERRVSSRGGRELSGGSTTSSSGLGERRNAPHALPGPINPQFHFGPRNNTNTSPINDSPFSFHPPDVPFQESRDPSLNVPRPTSGRPFSGLSSVGGASAISGRPSTSGSARPASGYVGGGGYGYGLRPGTGTSTTDPASYALSRGTKRPYTADSSDGGSASGRDSAFRFGGRDRPVTAITAADDDARPASRRLSLMELCTPPASAAGRPRTGTGWGVLGALGGNGGGRPSTADTGSRWTGKTAVDEADEYELELPAVKLSPRDGLRRISRGSAETGPLVDGESEKSPTDDAHPAAYRLVGQHEVTATADDVPRSVEERRRVGDVSLGAKSLLPNTDHFARGRESSAAAAAAVRSPDERETYLSRSPSASHERFVQGSSTSPIVDVKPVLGGDSQQQQQRSTRSQSVLSSVAGSRRSSVDSSPAAGLRIVKPDPDAAADASPSSLRVTFSRASVHAPASRSASASSSRRHTPSSSSGGGNGMSGRAAVGNVRG